MWTYLSVLASTVSRRADILAQGKAQLDRLEAMRKLFTKSRALSLAQRALLYAKDELEMCTMRMRVSIPPTYPLYDFTSEGITSSLKKSSAGIPL